MVALSIAEIREKAFALSRSGRMTYARLARELDCGPGVLQNYIERALGLEAVRDLISKKGKSEVRTSARSRYYVPGADRRGVPSYDAVLVALQQYDASGSLKKLRKQSRTTSERKPRARKPYVYVESERARELRELLNKTRTSPELCA